MCTKYLNHLNSIFYSSLSHSTTLLYPLNLEFLLLIFWVLFIHPAPAKVAPLPIPSITQKSSHQNTPVKQTSYGQHIILENQHKSKIANNKNYIPHSTTSNATTSPINSAKTFKQFANPSIRPKTAHHPHQNRSQKNSLNLNLQEPHTIRQ